MKMPVTAENNYNRNKNVIVFGPSGSGKSYSVAGPQLLQFNSNYVLSDPKGELLDTYGNVLVSQGYDVKVFNLKDRDKSDHYNPFAYIHDTDDIVVLIDPEQEYTHLVTAMGGVVIDISASSPSHINPMDITEDYGDDEDPIRLKSQFLQNFCQLILHSSELSPQERTFIDVAAGLTYQRYMANPKREEMPTLHNFYRNLALQGEEVKPLLTALKLYVSGSMDLFAHQTNVNVQNHCICFNTVKLGKSMQSIGMLTVLDQVWNRITRNRVLGRRTWVFTDEFQQLLGNKDCTDFYFQLSSRARKWGAILTSITQHVRSVLDNEDARRMLSDCGYIKLLNQSPDDANDLARLLHISNEEKRYIENAEVGSGLLIVSKTVVPFNNDFPKDTELFRLMDTSPNRKPSEKG